MSEPELPLASEFPAKNQADWRRLAEQALRGAPFDKLQSQTADGISLEPIYARETAAIDHGALGVPGAWPFTRGADSAGSLGGWDVRQRLEEPELEELNRAALSELERGATSLCLVWDRAGRAGLDPDIPGADVGIDGVAISSLADLERALSGVELELACVALEAGPAFSAAATLFLALLEQRSVDPAHALGELGMDPIGALHTEGWLPKSPPDALVQMASLSRHSAERYPKLRSVSVSTRIYSDAGASDAQELALALATGVEYLRALLAGGLSLPSALGQLVFELSVGTRQLEEISKLRAARKLWARVCEASAASLGVTEELPEMRIGACMAWRSLSQRDPWVNLLRATSAGFSAAVGGASSVTLFPYNAELGIADEFARRVARNTQLVLMEEAHICRVLDPAGGSYAIEHLTDQLAIAAWEQFQKIEAAGGLLAFSTSGALAPWLAETRAERSRQIARRKQPITGVSEYPNIHEAPVRVRELDEKQLNLELVARLERKQIEIDPACTQGAGCDPAAWIAAARQGATLGQLSSALGSAPTRLTKLPRVRFAADFEALRDKADLRLKTVGTRERVLLACIGSVAEHTARATFSKNLFEAGGFEALSSGESLAEDQLLDPNAAGAALAQARASVAVLCSTDALYEAHAESFARALRAAGAKRVYLAGHPKLQARDFASVEGGGHVDDFVFAGVDVLSVLRAAHAVIGGKS